MHVCVIIDTLTREVKCQHQNYFVQYPAMTSYSLVTLHNRWNTNLFYDKQPIFIIFTFSNIIISLETKFLYQINERVFIDFCLRKKNLKKYMHVCKSMRRLKI